MAFSTNRPLAYDYQGRVTPSYHDVANNRYWDAKDQVWRDIDDMERNPAFDTFDEMDRQQLASRTPAGDILAEAINMTTAAKTEDPNARKVAGWAESDKEVVLEVKRRLGEYAHRFRMLVSSILQDDSVIQESIFVESGLTLNDLWSFNIAGGAPASLFLGRIPNDIDMYFYGPKCTEVLRFYRFLFTKYLREHPEHNMVTVDGFKASDGYGDGAPTEEDDILARQLESLKNSNAPYAYVTDNAISLVHSHLLGGLKFKIITIQYGDPESIVQSYDFRHCQAYYNALDDKFTLSKEIYNCIVERKLVVVPERKKINTRRIRKYLDRGYTLKEPYALGGDSSFTLDPAMVREEIEDVLKRYDILTEKMEAIVGLVKGLVTPWIEVLKERRPGEIEWQTEARVRFEPTRKGILYDITP